MHHIPKIFLLVLLCTDAVYCEATVDNSTVISRREILEQQARTAYQNACYRLQEISNWMNAAFRIKSVWASATVNEIASRSEGALTESDRSKTILPPRTKTAGAECSFSSVQATAQTYAYLQSQLVMMKWLLGRNIFKSSKERLGGAKERIKVLETFNTTMNDVVSKLKQDTANTSISVDSEAWRSANVREGRFLQLLRIPTTFIMNILDDQVMNNRIRKPSEPKSFFQNLGRNLDKLMFPVVPAKLNDGTEQPAPKEEESASTEEQSPPNTGKPTFTTERSPFSSEKSPFTIERSPFSSEKSPFLAEKSPFITETSPFSAKLSATRTEQSVSKTSKNNAIMYSSIF